MTTVTICMTTWAPDTPEGQSRARGARKVLDSWMQDLIYDGPMRLHIADDGSTLLDYPQSLVDSDRFREAIMRRRPMGPFVEAVWSAGAREGVGASLNRSLSEAFNHGQGLYLVDDWLLTDGFLLDPWVDLLDEREDIGMVRFGIPHPDLTGRIEWNPDHGLWYLRLDRHHYAFGHRPALYHERMMRHYGWFTEGVNAFDCERIYAEHWARSPGPDIVYALPTVWEHLDWVEYGGVQP